MGDIDPDTKKDTAKKNSKKQVDTTVPVTNKGPAKGLVGAGYEAQKQALQPLNELEYKTKMRVEGVGVPVVQDIGRLYDELFKTMGNRDYTGVPAITSRIEQQEKKLEGIGKEVDLLRIAGPLHQDIQKQFDRLEDESRSVMNSVAGRIAALAPAWDFAANAMVESIEVGGPFTSDPTWTGGLIAMGWGLRHDAKKYAAQKAVEQFKKDMNPFGG